MSRIYTDYLFTLYVNCNPVSLEMLLEQTGATDKVKPASVDTPEHILKTMEDSGLIEMLLVDGIQYVNLTEHGKKVSVFAADVITAMMLSEWQQEVLGGNSHRKMPSARENVRLKSA